MRNESDRLMEKIKIINEHWLWQGARTKSGTGLTEFRGKTTTARIALYAIANGEIPVGRLYPNCGESAYVNPLHQRESWKKVKLKEMIYDERI